MNRYLGCIARMRAERGDKCQRCPSSKGLQFAHVKPTGLYGRGRGRAERYHDIQRHPDAYELLCRRCHMKLDWGRQAEAPTEQPATESAT